ncbi:methyltransferase [Kitasatospora sp. NPDC101157]|uniref:methyltransferase n=1 Tax=Kitasatospora sp. NPDC101157 TaxID=3364098 RepID=UPI003813A68A
MPESPSGGAAIAFAPLIFGVLTFQAYTTAVRLGVPDAVGDEPRTAAELAAALDADETNLHRLLRALVALDVLRYTEDGRFALTAAGAELRESDESGARGLVAFFGEPLMWRTFGALEASIRTGAPAFTEVTGEGFFDHFVKDPSFARSYHRGMHWGTAMMAPLLQMGYDWAASRRIVDVGGGDGSLLTVLLGAAPQAEGVVFDSAEALEGLAACARRAGVADRCTGEAGDFLTAVPAGGDAYLLKNVLHEWGDADCVRILRNCREAMAEDGKVLIVATLLPEPGAADDPSAFTYAALSDLQLMSASNGERTLAEYTRLCAEAGLRVTGVTKVPYLPNDNVVEAVLS